MRIHGLDIDETSFNLGMINCFAEMVAAGVKHLAISPPLLPLEYDRIRGASDAIVEGSGILSWLETSLMVTDLQTPEFTRQLHDYFSDLVSQKLKELGMLSGKECVLLPVPLHKKRLNYRGFNQAELIARGVERRMCGAAQVLEVLKRVKHTSQQARLSKRERHENLAEAFEVTADLIGFSDKVCFLVDDVCTTGATLDNCARALKQAGLKKVYGLVVARAFK